MQKFKRKKLRKEDNVTGGGASFSSGYGENYATPRAFGKNKKKKYKLTHVLGYKPVPKKKYHTKTFDVVKWHENLKEIKIIPQLRVLEPRTDNLWKDDKHYWSFSPEKMAKLLNITYYKAYQYIMSDFFTKIIKGIELIPQNDSKFASIIKNNYENFLNYQNTKPSQRELDEDIGYTDEFANQFYEDTKSNVQNFQNQLIRLKNIFLAITIDDLLTDLETIKRHIPNIEKILNSIDKIKEKLDNIGFDYADKNDWTNRQKFSDLEKIYSDIYEGYYAIQWFLEEIVSKIEEFVEEKQHLYNSLNNISD